MASALAGVTLGEIQSAIFQKLAGMTETAHIAGLRQDGQRGDRTDARQCLQTLKVRIAREQLLGTLIQLIRAPIQLGIAGRLQAERFEGRRIERHRKPYALASQIIDVLQLSPFVDLASDQVPGRGNKGLTIQGADGGRNRKAFQESNVPLRASGMPIASELRKIQRQMSKSKLCCRRVRASVMWK